MTHDPAIYLKLQIDLIEIMACSTNVMLSKFSSLNLNSAPCKLKVLRKIIWVDDKCLSVADSA